MAFEHKREKLKKEIEDVLYRLGIDNDLNTPDFVLAEHVVVSLESLEFKNTERKKFVQELITGQERVEEATSDE